MKPPRLPAGRGPYESVSVLRLEGSARPVLGRSEPPADDRRARAAAQWGTGPATPRHSPLATIDLPLPPRVQTALSYRIDPGLARQLTGGPSPPPASRQEATRPVHAVVTVGDAKEPAAAPDED